MKNAIKIESLYKTYGSGFFCKRKIPALKNINLEIFKGEIFGLLGPNGAGKTTLLNTLSCQLLLDKGKVDVLGYDVSNGAPPELKVKLNMCSGNPNFPWSMTVREILKFYAMLYGLQSAKRKNMIDKCIETFELNRFADSKYDTLSTGTKQRLALAKSFINNPEVLFLDEPTIGLDPDIAIHIRETIKKLHKNTNITILLTTHYMKEAEELAGRIAFIKDGEIKTVGSSEEILKATKAEDLEGAFLELNK